MASEIENQLLTVLKKHKNTITWKVVDSKGLRSSIIMHKILMEDECKPKIQPPRCLNLALQEVVGKEVVKLLDVGNIYLISDSAIISPIQVVPKNVGMTVIKNVNNELIPTRTLINWRMCINYKKLNEATTNDHFL